MRLNRETDGGRDLRFLRTLVSLYFFMASLALVAAYTVPKLYVRSSSASAWELLPKHWLDFVEIAAIILFAAASWLAFRARGSSRPKGGSWPISACVLELVVSIGSIGVFLLTRDYGALQEAWWLPLLVALFSILGLIAFWSQGESGTEPSSRLNGA